MVLELVPVLGPSCAGPNTEYVCVSSTHEKLEQEFGGQALVESVVYTVPV